METSLFNQSWGFVIPIRVYFCIFQKSTQLSGLSELVLLMLSACSAGEIAFAFFSLEFEWPRSLIKMHLIQII